MRNPFRDPAQRRRFDAALAAAADKNSELYWNGKPRTGAAHRCAFWAGYDNRRPLLIPRGTIAWAFYRAGQAFRKQTDHAR